eukprot:3535600-Pyramimonas_sp.AAC.1
MRGGAGYLPAPAVAAGRPVGDEAGHHAQDGEGFDLHVGGGLRRLALVQRNERVVLLVHVQVLDQTLAQKVVEGAVPVLKGGGGTKSQKVR